jgi:predicted  nucleic acid-binding Zn-ribbon protein
MVGLFFILGLIIVSGLVAYVGDNVGRKVGRKKMRLFGLRPKYTSIIVAIITGMVITAITISALLIFSKDVRIMLFQLEELQEDLATAQADIEKVQQVLDATSMQLDNTKTDLMKVEVELSDAEAVISSRDRDIILKQKLLDEAQTEYDSLVAQQQALDEQITSLSASLSTVRDQVNDLNAQANLRIAEVADLESQRNQLFDQLSDLTAQMDGLKSTISELQAEEKQYLVKIDKMKSGGVKVIKGQILQDFTISTSLTDSEIIKKIIGVKVVWDTKAAENEHGNLMSEFTIEQYSGVIEAVNRYRDKYNDDIAVIRVIAAEHVFEDEVVPVLLKVERHLRIYDAGEIIIKRRFNMGDSQGTIRNGLIEMLQTLEDEALASGMIFEGLEDAVWADPTVIVEMARKASFYPNDIYINRIFTTLNICYSPPKYRRSTI